MRLYNLLTERLNSTIILYHSVYTIYNVGDSTRLSKTAHKHCQAYTDPMMGDSDGSRDQPHI